MWRSMLSWKLEIASPEMDCMTLGRLSHVTQHTQEAGAPNHRLILLDNSRTYWPRDKYLPPERRPMVCLKRRKLYIYQRRNIGHSPSQLTTTSIHASRHPWTLKTLLLQCISLSKSPANSLRLSTLPLMLLSNHCVNDSSFPFLFVFPLAFPSPQNRGP